MRSTSAGRAATSLNSYVHDVNQSSFQSKELEADVIHEVTTYAFLSLSVHSRQRMRSSWTMISYWTRSSIRILIAILKATFTGVVNKDLLFSTFASFSC